MGKLTINDIAGVLVDKNGLDRREANQFVTELFAVIMERLNAGEQVKVKGLGTFKIIGVEARESVSVRTGERVTISGHSKLTFIPDATMKELVNKPFSQFETVVLNDGVEFDDMKVDTKDEAKDEELEEESEETVVEETVVEEAVVEEAVAQETVVEETAVDEAAVEEAVAEEAVVEETAVEETAVEEAVVEKTDTEDAVAEEHLVEVAKEDAPVEEANNEDIMEDNDKKHPWRWLLYAVGILALMALSAYGGYYYGINRPIPDVVPDTVFVRDTVVVEKDSIQVATQELEGQEAVKDTMKTVEQPVEQPVEKPVEKPIEKKEDKKQEAKPAQTVDVYAEKDARVRLGAYRIVGLEREVKVQAGQTFYGICRANLGPDMECYVEVYNNLPQNPTIKEGQIIKIPKLQLKKRSKK